MRTTRGGGGGGRRSLRRCLHLHTARWQSRDLINISFWTHRSILYCLLLDSLFTAVSFAFDESLTGYLTLLGAAFLASRIESHGKLLFRLLIDAPAQSAPKH
jgi:hypothetical protein